MDSVVNILILALILLGFLALAIKILSKKVVAALLLITLFCWVLHPRLRDELLAIFSPIAGVVIPLLLMLLGLRMIIRGKLR